MYNTVHRDNDYTDSLKKFIRKEYNIDAVVIAPANRGYYGETWKLETSERSYFVKIDYSPRHQNVFRNSLPVMQYLCESGIDFIGTIIKTGDGRLYSDFNSAILGVFDWIEGENIETDETKTPEYQMLCKIYHLTKQGFDIPTIAFSDDMATRFYEKWESLKTLPSNDANDKVKAILESNGDELLRRSTRLKHFASLCKSDTDDFYITHGDAGKNFFVAKDRNYIVDWDEVMYAPLEHDAWEMGCRDWARKLFNDTLKENNINYELRLERLAFYCYHMYFYFLDEFLDELLDEFLGDFMLHGIVSSIEEYFDDSDFMVERIQFADTI